MNERAFSRRGFLAGAAALGPATMAMGVSQPQVKAAAVDRAAAPRLHVATNQYPWGTFWQREGRNFQQQIEEGLDEVAAAGLDGFEPMLATPDDASRIGQLLRQRKLQMRSFYTNSVLHEPAQAEQSIATVTAIAAAAKRFGARTVVTNPSPIDWTRKSDKNDRQLRFQAQSLERLGRELWGLGMTLSYHNHDMELRNAAREFHHMLTGTDPRYVTFCLDAHWVYRGSGNSTVALFDVLRLYGPRVTELHLRQSKAGVWTETFAPGDIDYEAIASHLASIGIRPLVVLEQAVEKGSANTVNAVEAHRRGSEYARKVFAAFA